MSSGNKQPFEMDIEELLIHAIERRNAASCHEIVGRKVRCQPIPSLVNFLYDEIKKLRLRRGIASPNSVRAEQATLPVNPQAVVNPNVTKEELDETIRMVQQATEYKQIDEEDHPDPICRLGREMLAHQPPFTGQGMDNQDKAETYIYLAADNPSVASELPEQGIRFWKAASVQFRGYRAKLRRKANA